MPLLNKLLVSTLLPLFLGATWMASPGKGSHGGGGSAAFRSMSSVTYLNRTDITINAPAGVQNGDILILYLTLGAASPPTPTLPSGFTVIQGPTTITDSGFSNTVRLAWKVASSEPGSYTISHATSNSQAIIVAISGASGSTPVSSMNTGTGTTTTATGITTPSNNAVVLFIASAWQLYTGASSPPSGTTPTFTEQYDGGEQSVFYVASGVLATAGATGSKTQANPNGAGEPFSAVLVSAGP
jgi:hypothetical protein